MRRITIEQAQEQGFIVDTHCYPYFGYKGPRFNPTHHVYVLTEMESALLSALRAARDTTQRDFRAISEQFQLCD